MATVMLWELDQTGLNFDGFAFDAVTTQSHNKSITMLKHPAEDGIQITDHLKTEPDTLDLSGIITNTVISIGAPLIYDRDRAEQIDAKLRGLFIEKIPVIVVTSLIVYDNMVLKTYRVSRSAEQGNAIFCDMSFEKIRIVESQTTQAPEIKKRVRSGRKPVSPASEKTEERSSVAKLLIATLKG